MSYSILTVLLSTRPKLCNFLLHGEASVMTLTTRRTKLCTHSLVSLQAFHVIIMLSFHSVRFLYPGRQGGFIEGAPESRINSAAFRRVHQADTIAAERFVQHSKEL